MTDSSAVLKRARVADSEARIARCDSVLRRMVAGGEPVSVAEVARRAKVKEKFPYRHPVLISRINEAKRAAATATSPDLDRALAVERDFWKERAQQLQRHVDAAVKRSPSSRANRWPKHGGWSHPTLGRRTTGAGGSAQVGGFRRSRPGQPVATGTWRWCAS